MLLGEFNFFILLFIVILISIIVNVNTALHLLLTAELLWITLYTTTLIVGLIFDNVNFLSLTFFFLILSAVEFSVGLVILLIQNVIKRSINLNVNNLGSLKFTTRLFKQVNSGKYQFR